MAILLLVPRLLHGQPAVIWEAYNDYRPSELTHANASSYDLRITDEGGPLRNIQTGEDLNARVRVLVEGDADPDDFGAISAAVDPNSPADKLFKGFVDTGGPNNPGLPGLRNSANIKLILIFEGLNPSRRYNFRGTVARAGGYNDRWSVFGITGASSYVTAHQDGSANQNLFTKATFPGGTLETNQVALNSGDNKAGSVIGWDNIDPGADGAFEIEAQQYVGTAPFGNPSAAPYGYGLNAIYLAEVQSTGNLQISENPSSQNVAAGATATFRVVASSPQPITYQWQKAAPGTTSFADVAGATQATYTTAVLTASDSGSRFRVKVSSGGIETTTPEVELLVDPTVPTLSSVTGSVNLNAVYLAFSEAIKLAQLGNSANYQLSGGLSINSATALNPQTVRLVTGAQTPGASYTVTVNNLEDLAGNKLAAGTASTFNAFNVTSNAVGVELWRNLTGSTVQNLRDYANYPNQPDEDYVIPTFDCYLVNVLTNFDNNTYGGRMRAWITPEETADYEFFIRADDQGELRISTDDKFDRFDNPDVVSNELPTAADTSSGDTFQEPGIDDSVSTPIRLERGKRYAMQALWKESNGSDYLQIAWRKAGDFTPADQLEPIPSRFLSYYGPVAAPPGQTPTISRIALSAGRVVVEWTGSALESSADLKAWTPVAGATSPYSESPQGNKFFRARR